MSGIPAPAPLAGLSLLAAAYDLILCDIWGVVHNGESHFAPACAALARFREKGGTVVLVTNAPRPHGPILHQLDGFRVPRASYDAVVTSGDVTLSLMGRRGAAPLCHIGPDRDLSLFEAAAAQGHRPKLVAVEAADYVVCTGLGETEDTGTPDDYAGTLAVMARRKLDMICANPDLVVHRGDELFYCAGALAAAYADIGGNVIQAGKPFPAIYDLAMARALAVRGAAVPKARILAIGDAMATDIAGAAALGVDALFVTHGIHRDELHSDGDLHGPAYVALAATAQRPPRAHLRELVW